MAGRHRLEREVPRRKVSQRKRGSREGRVPVCRLLCEVSRDCQAAPRTLLDRESSAGRHFVSLLRLNNSPRPQLANEEEKRCNALGGKTRSVSEQGEVFSHASSLVIHIPGLTQ
ncbi:unnamed protein product [Pleuronectes platessa]|uniref:Uncharacterized protein n=1 Tax=Pleuronectes platessa TaxID=8262 RepID=A0A9N7V122_PLEPL|nr:unnamed protein product [Pleuronectes platessa]